MKLLIAVSLVVLAVKSSPDHASANLSEELVAFYKAHLEFSLQSEPKALLERQLSWLPSDEELKRIFGDHADLGKSARDRERAKLQGFSIEKLSDYIEDLKRKGKIKSVTAGVVPSFMTTALKNKGYILEHIYMNTVEVTFENGFIVSNEFAYVNKRWVLLPNISWEVRQGNMR